MKTTLLVTILAIMIALGIKEKIFSFSLNKENTEEKENQKQKKWYIKKAIWTDGKEEKFFLNEDKIDLNSEIVTKTIEKNFLLLEKKLDPLNDGFFKIYIPVYKKYYYIDTPELQIYDIETKKYELNNYSIYKNDIIENGESKFNWDVILFLIILFFLYLLKNEKQEVLLFLISIVLSAFLADITNPIDSFYRLCLYFPFLLSLFSFIIIILYKVISFKIEKEIKNSNLKKGEEELNSSYFLKEYIIDEIKKDLLNLNPYLMLYYIIIFITYFILIPNFKFL